MALEYVGQSINHIIRLDMCLKLFMWRSLAMAFATVASAALSKLFFAGVICKTQIPIATWIMSCAVTCHQLGAYAQISLFRPTQPLCIH